MVRKTNPELCAEFRALLTTGFRITEDGIASIDLMSDEQQRDEALRVTKPWRNDLWKAFAEIEERLDPLGVESRRRERRKANGEETRKGEAFEDQAED